MTSPSDDNQTQADDYKTYGEIVWGQFKKYKISYYSLYAVAGLFVLAMVSPLIALNVPFYLYVPEGVGPENLQGTSYPWLTALFDQNFFNSGVDIFFNYLLFFVPFTLLVWFVVSRIAGAGESESGPTHPAFFAGVGLLLVGLLVLTIGLQDLVSEYTIGVVVLSAIVGWLLFTLCQTTNHFSRRNVFFAVATVVGTIGFIMVYYHGFRQPFVDYHALLELDDGVRAIFPLVEHSYRDVNLMATSESPSRQYLLGTDEIGRDLFTRILYGTRISLTIGVVAVGIYATIGVILGSLGGYFGGRVDAVILRLIEIMMCFPVIFLLLTIAGFIEEASVFHIMLIIGLTGWTGIARLVRGEFLRLRNQDFVQAAIALGLTQKRIIFRHIMPNAIQPVYVAATFGIAGAILIEATLAFLGVGPPDVPSWGQILTAGRSTQNMTMILSSGFAIFVVISLLNLVGEGLRDATDPKMRK